MKDNKFFGEESPIKDIEKHTWTEQVGLMGKRTLDAALVELKQDFVSNRVYMQNPNGTYSFNHGYIDHLMTWMMTDSMSHMNEKEKEFTNDFVEFEEHYSWTALTTDLGGKAIGASTAGHVVDDKYVESNVQAQPIRDDIPKKALYKALDEVIMTIVNETYVPITF